MDKKLKIAVCDDNEDILKQTTEQIEKWSEELRIPIQIFSFSNGDELIKADFSNKLDIIFLDIIMPLLSGMETARELRLTDSAVKIIFLTSSPEFALESYDVKAEGYLLKPVSYEKIKKTLDDCCKELIKEAENIVIRTDFGYLKIYYHDIEFIEAMNKKVAVHLSDGKIYETNEPLYYFEAALPLEKGFFKCHRSYLVYMPNVHLFNTTEITFKSGKSVPIARGYSKEFKEAYFALMFSATGN